MSHVFKFLEAILMSRRIEWMPLFSGHLVQTRSGRVGQLVIGNSLTRFEGDFFFGSGGSLGNRSSETRVSPN